MPQEVQHAWVPWKWNADNLGIAHESHWRCCKKASRQEHVRGVTLHQPFDHCLKRLLIPYFSELSLCLRLLILSSGFLARLQRWCIPRGADSLFAIIRAALIALLFCLPLTSQFERESKSKLLMSVETFWNLAMKFDQIYLRESLSRLL